uniref:Uncharacterized protein n=1 Tax=Rhizophora mucronata TaxID=61149 RepID=A0A2P2QX50_RHIMU
MTENKKKLKYTIQVEIHSKRNRIFQYNL